MKLPTKEYLDQCFSYNRDNGVLSWRYRPSTHFKNYKGWKICNGKFAGKEIRTINGNKYGEFYRVRLDGKRYYVHVIVWLMHYGEMTEERIDHIDKNRLNNRLDNLRNTSIRECMMNKGKFSKEMDN